MTTTAPEAKARIIALLQAWPALSAVTIQPKGPEREGDVHPEMVFLGRIRGEQDWSSLGNRQRSETYTIDLFIRTWVAQAGTTELDLDTRCWAIFAATADALRSDPGLTGLLDGNVQVKTFEQDSVPTLEPIGWRGWLDAQLLVTAHVRRT